MDEQPNFPDLIAHPAWPDAQDWEGWVEYFSQGSCHILALAAAELWKDEFSHFYVVTNPLEASWVNPEDSDDFLPCVVHVYAAFNLPDDQLTLDIFGWRPAPETLKETSERYSVGNDAEGDTLSKLCLAAYIDQDDPNDPAYGHRPLHSVSPNDIEEAKQLLSELYPDLAIPRRNT